MVGAGKVARTGRDVENGGWLLRANALVSTTGTIGAEWKAGAGMSERDEESGISWNSVLFAVVCLIWIIALRVRVENLQDHVVNLQHRVGQLEQRVSQR